MEMEYVVLFLPLIYVVMQLEMRTATLVSWSSQMNRLSRILSAVDFSETARAAFDNALVLSRTHNAELTVVHAIPKEERFGQYARERIAMIPDGSLCGVPSVGSAAGLSRVPELKRSWSLS